MHNKEVENSIRVVRKWLEESAKHGLENYIEDVKFETAKEEKMSIAKKMLHKNMDITDIIEVTGLTKKQIMHLN